MRVVGSIACRTGYEDETTRSSTVDTEEAEDLVFSQPALGREASLKPSSFRSSPKDSVLVDEADEHSQCHRYT